jgi:RNA polymerase sigma factor (sigma-70 family)
LVRSDGGHEFEALCRSEYAAVVRAAYLMTGDREVALDVAQEAFARAYQHRRMLAGLDRPAAWVHRVATNEAPSSLRKRRVRSRPHPVQLTALSPEPVTPDDDLLAAVRSLAPAQRAAIVLRYYLDMSVEDAAAALGKRPGTVRALTSQALARLRERLPQETRRDG